MVSIKRSKRIEAKNRKRNQLRSKKQSKLQKSKKHQSFSKIQKVNEHEVILRDGGVASFNKYYSYWHIFSQAKRVGRVWLTLKPRSELLAGIFISVEIYKNLQGKGIGQIAFRLACETSNENIIFGESRKGNIASIKAMEKAGFVLEEKTKSGVVCYKWIRGIKRRRFPLKNRSLFDIVDISDHNFIFYKKYAESILRNNHGISKDPKLAKTFENKYQLASNFISQFYKIFYSQGRTICFSMVHSWALVGVSHHIWKTKRIPNSIIHIDDHTDMDSCFLTGNKTLFGLGNAPYDLSEPSTIIENIFRGTFNKGSFMTAYFKGATINKFHQMCWPKSRKTTKYRTVSLDHTYMESSVAGKTAFTSGPNLPEDFYSQNDKLWLDIDLDAFCNRYNGDSDKKNLRATKHERNQMFQRIEKGVSQIIALGLINSAEVITFSTSPGFFPCEYWEESLQILTNALEISYNDLF